jgi:hypothetical protein
MNEKISPFVKANKPWIIRKVLAEYLRAKNMFGNIDRESNNGRITSYENLKKLSELLFIIKEDLHLLFKRIIDPLKGKFDNTQKFIPNQDETEFVNNVGLLYHKAMAAREVKYVMEHYSTDSEDYAESKASLDSYLRRMRTLLDDGIRLMKKILIDYSTNVVVMSYLLENDHYIEESLNENAQQLWGQIVGKDGVDEAYVRVSEYLLESGWKDRARKILSDAIKLNPENEQARELLLKTV